MNREWLASGSDWRTCWYSRRNLRRIFSRQKKEWKNEQQSPACDNRSRKREAQKAHALSLFWSCTFLLLVCVQLRLELIWTDRSRRWTYRPVHDPNSMLCRLAMRNKSAPLVESWMKVWNTSPFLTFAPFLPLGVWTNTHWSTQHTGGCSHHAQFSSLRFLANSSAEPLSYEQ
jgi:hypothetical protein